MAGSVGGGSQGALHGENEQVWNWGGHLENPSQLCQELLWADGENLMTQAMGAWVRVLMIN